jgi:hypothetical protein
VVHGALVAPRPPARARSWRRPALLVVATAALTAAALAGSARRWPLPQRVPGGWRVTAVPGSLALFLAAVAVCCLAVAAVLTLDALPARPRTGRVGWWVAVLAAAAGTGWHALLLAGQGRLATPAVPVLDWALALVPALVAGTASVAGGARAALAAALGTGVVSLPLVAAGWGLYDSRAAGAAFGAPLTLTIWLGALPLLCGAALSWIAARAYADGTGAEQSPAPDVYSDARSR